MNKTYFLLKNNQYQERVNLIKHFKSNITGTGTVLFANLFYFTLLEKSLDSKDYWLEPPTVFTMLDSTKEWVKIIKCESLLKYVSISTLRNVLVSFKKSGLIKVDERNRLFLMYPINNNMLSIEEAAKTLMEKDK